MSTYTISLIITFDKRDTPAPPGVGVCFYGGFSFFFLTGIGCVLQSMRRGYIRIIVIYIFFWFGVGQTHKLRGPWCWWNYTKWHTRTQRRAKHAPARWGWLCATGGPMFAMLLMLRVIGTNTAARRRFIGANDTCKWPYNDSRVVFVCVYVCAKWTTCETL